MEPRESEPAVESKGTSIMRLVLSIAPVKPRSATVPGSITETSAPESIRVGTGGAEGVNGTGTIGRLAGREVGGLGPSTASIDRMRERSVSELGGCSL